MARLAGKAAIITGAGSGIGAAAASLPGRIAASPAFTTFEADIAQADAPAAIVAAAIAAFGQLDILFNNAGVASSVPAADLSDEEWDRINNVNLRAVFRLTRAAIPHLVHSPAGRIINTASVMAEGTDYGLAAYCASKAGVGGLTRALALELGKHGVTANYLLPGAIRTGMTSALWDARPDIAEIWARKSVLRRLGAPEDLARAALFLASDDAAFITGQGLAVDGGMRLRI
jgi:3-oxoacyl-[acyl-carrier protein] reductase